MGNECCASSRHEMESDKPLNFAVTKSISSDCSLPEKYKNAHMCKVSSDPGSDMTQGLHLPKKGANLKVMTWNLQGILPDELTKRTSAVAEIILKETPSIVLCQELVDSSYNQLTSLLSNNYIGVKGTEKTLERYFTGIFYRTEIFQVINSEVIPFKNSVMARTLLLVELKFQNLQQRVVALTTHSESLSHYWGSRKAQLTECFKACLSFPDDYIVLFGGDLNIEDENEIADIIPSSMKDAWVEAGSPKETELTFDSKENRNLKMFEATENLPRRRLDRIYFRSCCQAEKLNLRNVELFGKALVKNSDYHPSDHWAVMTTFELNM